MCLSAPRHNFSSFHLKQWCVTDPLPPNQHERTQEFNSGEGVNTVQCIALHMKNVTTRMSEEELELVERLARETGATRSDAVRAAVREGAQERLIRTALERYRAGDVGMRGAAAIAGVSIAEMMREANQRGVLSNYDEADLEGDIDALR